ncbi:MAG: glutamate racemase [Acidobacteriota bacterium]
MSWGVFDSGVGGLTVARAVRDKLPGLPLTYLGDTARVPYGIRSADTIRRYAHEAAEFLHGSGVEGIIVACNTASALALDVFRDLFPGPVQGVVGPGSLAAVEATRNGRIGVIGTPATIRSQAYAERIRSLQPAAEVLSIACPLFVPLAEEGWTDGDVPRLIAERYLAPLIQDGVDTVVLGCTHYPLLTPVIRQVMGENVTLVDSAEAIANTTLRHAQETNRHDWLQQPAEQLADHLFVTDAGGSFHQVAARFLGRELPRLETVTLGH